MTDRSDSDKQEWNRVHDTAKNQTGRGGGEGGGSRPGLWKPDFSTVTCGASWSGNWKTSGDGRLGVTLGVGAGMDAVPGSSPLFFRLSSAIFSEAEGRREVSDVSFSDGRSEISCGGFVDFWPSARTLFRRGCGRSSSSRSCFFSAPVFRSAKASRSFPFCALALSLRVGLGDRQECRCAARALRIAPLLFLLIGYCVDEACR